MESLIVCVVIQAWVAFSFRHFENVFFFMFKAFQMKL